MYVISHSVFPILLSLLISSGPSYAAVFNIPSGNVTALIAAINAANTNGETNTITLEPGTYTLSAVDNGAFSDANGLPVIASTLTINGDHAENTIIERSPGAPRLRILSNAISGKLTVDRLTVRGGSDGSGTGIRNGGSLTVSRSIIEENDTPLWSDSTIYNTGGLRISDTHIRNNASFHGASGILNLGTLTLVTSTIMSNVSDGATVENGTLGEAFIQNRPQCQWIAFGCHY